MPGSQENQQQAVNGNCSAMWGSGDYSASCGGTTKHGISTANRFRPLKREQLPSGPSSPRTQPSMLYNHKVALRGQHTMYPPNISTCWTSWTATPSTCKTCGPGC